MNVKGLKLAGLLCLCVLLMLYVAEWVTAKLRPVAATVGTNLLTNAARYAAGAPVEVRVWRDGTMAHVSVRDHGRGIQSEDQAKIFERFARAVSASEISGMGLGLYISREILEAHGGSIRVESELGSGSTFTMSLPAG